MDKRAATVTWWSEGGLPSRYEDCVIIDRSNWSCTVPGAAGRPLVVGFADGTYGPDRGATLPYMYGFPRWKFLLLRLQFGGPPMERGVALFVLENEERRKFRGDPALLR